MKTREYKKGQNMFCPRCHKQVKPPFEIGENMHFGKLILKCQCGKGEVTMVDVKKPEEVTA